MINSMTGFGWAEGELKGVNYCVEIKSVNNRYFKTHVKHEGLDNITRVIIT